MKDLRTFLLLICFVFSASMVFAQGFTYQAVIRDGNNALIENTTVQIQIIIHQGTPMGTSVVEEVHNPTTNEVGLVTFEIGSIDPGFSSVDWSNGPFFLEQNISPDNDGNYTIMSNTKLLSVPFAKYADEAGRASVADALAEDSGVMESLGVPIGTVMPFAGDASVLSNPAYPQFLNWMLCDGTTLTKTTYNELYAIIGDNYTPLSNQGAQIFNIPDLTGRHPVGKGSGANFGQLGNANGAESYSLDAANLPPHTHDIDPHGHGYTDKYRPYADEDLAENSGGSIAMARGDQITTDGKTSSQVGLTTDDGPGTSQAFSILDPFLVMNYIIKVR